MSKLGIFMAPGCEEVEALAVVDLVRRAKIDICMISITDKNTVTGSHNITFFTDATKDEVDYDLLDGIILPGGMPGTLNLEADEIVQNTIRSFNEDGKMVAAICAAPSVLGEAGLLQGKSACCYPGFEDKLLGAYVETKPVVRDGNIITSRGMGTAVAFGLAIVEYVLGEETANELKAGILAE